MKQLNTKPKSRVNLSLQKILKQDLLNFRKKRQKNSYKVVPNNRNYEGGSESNAQQFFEGILFWSNRSMLADS